MNSSDQNPLQNPQENEAAIGEPNLIERLEAMAYDPTIAEAIRVLRERQTKPTISGKVLLSRMMASHPSKGEPYCPYCDSNREVLANESDPSDATLKPCPACSTPDAKADNAAVDAFSTEMKAKLAEARMKGRGGWHRDEPGMHQRLSRMLRQSVEKGDPRDVANFCMFLNQRGEGIGPAEQSDDNAAVTAIDFEGRAEGGMNAGFPQSTRALAPEVVKELVEADRAYDDARYGVARARYNGEPIAPWMDGVSTAEARRAAALAAAVKEAKR